MESESSLGAARAVEVLARAAEARWNLSELSRELRIERRALGRTVVALESTGYVVRDQRHRLLPGPALVALARVVSQRRDLRTLSQAIIDELVARTACTVILHRVLGTTLVPEIVATPRDEIAVSYPSGRAIALWEGVGRAALATLPGTEIDRISREVGRTDLRELIAADEARGMALSLGEVVPGVSAIGCAVMEGDIAVGVLAVTSLRPSVAPEHGMLLRDAAMRLSERLTPAGETAGG